MPDGELDHDRLIRLEERLRCIEEKQGARDHLLSAMIALGGLIVAGVSVLFVLLRG